MSFNRQTKIQISVTLLSVLCFVCSAQADTDEIIANSVADLQVFPANGQDRNELILGNTNGDRIYITRFDTSVIEPFLTPEFELVSAEVILTEQSSRDALNGDQNRSVSAYFFSTAECSLWGFADVDNLNNFQDGVNPWFGNTQARPGRFGGQGTGGNSNVDLRADIDSNEIGCATGSISFVTGASDSVSIDLTNGSGLSLEMIETILADWVAGDNGGIGFIDRSSTVFPDSTMPLGQIFFQSGNVPGGTAVNSTVNGVVSGDGVAQDGESGNGLGGPQLRLVFCPADMGGILGDLNGDGVVDLLDVAPFVEALTNSKFDPLADINQDGFDDLLDVQPFIDLITGG